MSLWTQNQIRQFLYSLYKDVERDREGALQIGANSMFELYDKEMKDLEKFINNPDNETILDSEIGKLLKEASSLKDVKTHLMKDPEFRKEYEKMLKEEQEQSNV